MDPEKFSKQQSWESALDRIVRGLHVWQEWPCATADSIEPRLDRLLSDSRVLNYAAQAEARADLEALADTLTVLSVDIRRERATAEDFNCFDVLGIRRREYVHSNVLAWLLHPMETHGISTAFLNRILEKVGLPICDESARSGVRVRREVAGSRSVVDIVVDMPAALLLIENKCDRIPLVAQIPLTLFIEARFVRRKTFHLGVGGGEIAAIG